MGLPNKCKKVNRSSSSLVTWLVPQFVKDMFSAEDPIHDIVIDNSRNFYTLYKTKSHLRFDLGDDGRRFYSFINRMLLPWWFLFLSLPRPHASSNSVLTSFFFICSVYEAYPIAFGRSKPKRIL